MAVPTIEAPLIIQVENAPQARPQSGLSLADVVYEYETEGGITRFSTLWFGGPNVQVGPVRSARTATVQLVQTYGATLLYSGASTYVEGLLQAAAVRKYDEISGDLFRIGSRRAPHNLYADQAHAAAVRSRAGAPGVTYPLWPRVAALPSGGAPAPRFSVPISDTEQPSFRFDAAAGGYVRTEPTGVLNDATTRKPWAPPTVVILQVPIVPSPNIEDVSGAHGLVHTLAGTGPAQVFTGGQIFSGTFNQGPSGPPALTLAGGAPAPIAAGQVLIILVRQGTGAHLG